MNRPIRNSYKELTFSLLTLAAQLDLFSRTAFMSRRKKIQYLHRAVFQQTRCRPQPLRGDGLKR